MGRLLDRLTRSVRATERATTHASALQMISPIAGPAANMQRVVWSEYFAGEIAEISRESALQVPPFKRGRDILVGVIGGMPLHEFEGDADVTPEWLRNSHSGISPWHRMAGTIDDLLWYDWSAWAVTRDDNGQITDALRIPFERWDIDEMTGAVTVDGNVVSAEEIIVFPGNGSGGLLVTGADTIKGYRALTRAWIGRAQNPIPLVELHQTSDDPLTDGLDENGELDPDAESDEIGRLVSEWAAARLSPNGAVAFTPPGIEVRTHGTASADMFVEARNAAVLDCARLLNLPASLLDGSQTQASLTYVTTEGKRSEFAALSIPAWTDPIEARLSLDDVAGPGRVIRFDRSNLVDVAPEPINNPKED